MNRDEMYLSLGVSDKVLQFGEAVLDELKPRFAGIEEIAELNQAKVIGAMQKNRVNATHFAASTGYGYDDGSGNTCCPVEHRDEACCLLFFCFLLFGEQGDVEHHAFLQEGFPVCIGGFHPIENLFFFVDGGSAFEILI